MLKGRKIVLRPLTQEDAPILQSWYMDKDFRTTYDEYDSVEMDAICGDIQRHQAGIMDPRAEKLTYMVLRKRDLAPVGICCLRRIDRSNRNAEVLLGIGEKEMRLAGYGLDVLIVLLDIAYYELGLERTYIFACENQPQGLKMGMNFGFVSEGRLRRHRFAEGRYWDVWVLGLLKEEYERLPIVPKWKR
ncbi:MAG: GNAT family N-acetyltransferase [Peptococcaceae bacterium]|jgi:RimJ/RimL family protein N-acetyltransferase|nr:GNAT family N-acetyltransferase [Peptococcaceae bacterium]